MSTHITRFLSAAALLVAASAHAQTADDQSKLSATQRALAAQRSGEIASTTEQHLSGKARAAAYKRYVDSFKQPIPASFIDDSFSGGE